MPLMKKPKMDPIKMLSSSSKDSKFIFSSQNIYLLQIDIGICNNFLQATS
ncbi:MAG: hypothetical protein ACTSXD_07035 [Candidatus Heimdallarchaeaceae archaeon]